MNPWEDASLGPEGQAKAVVVEMKRILDEQEGINPLYEPEHEALITAAIKAAYAKALPPLNEDMIEILGRPNFTCSGVANILRMSGMEIKTRSENEQAATIHWLMTMYLKHGTGWLFKANDELIAIRDEWANKQAEHKKKES